jgi:aspartate-semialdehyde dehydrogenase
MNKSIPVTVLAATGSVGQRFVQLLDGHPWFRVVALTASDRSEGRPYGETCHWILPEPMPAWARNLLVLPTTTEAVSSVAKTPIVFSALPTEIAKEVEPQFAKAGMLVCSNASAYRKEPDVPILLPEVNPEHATLVNFQRRHRGWRGGIVTNPNCTSTGLTIVLGALQSTFGIRRGFVVSLQALSGAGYPGVPSMDILDNTIPFINGEEAKVEWEPRKMLGKIKEDSIELADFVLSAHTNRVAVSDGHIVCLSVELDRRTSIEEVNQVIRSYQAPEISRNLPSTPQPIILIRDEDDRPQPRLDRMTGKGMTTIIGRIRKDSIFDLKMVILSHNTIRGAAGGSIYNAELFNEMGLVEN